MMSSIPSWKNRVSIFSRNNLRRGETSSRTVVASKYASLGAGLFVIFAQIIVLTSFFIWIPLDELNIITLFFLMIFFNIVMLWNWSPNPGFVIESEEINCEEDKAILHYCRICQIWQPLRSKHCNKCDKCVRKYDHHCFWIGGCVGEFNHLRFFILLTVALIYVIYLFPNILKCFKFGDYKTIDSAILRNFIPLILTIVDFFIILLIFILWVVQGVLLVQNLTTWEFSSRHRITYLNSKKGNPFNKGIWLNILFLFRRKPIDWRYLLNRNDSELV